MLTITDEMNEISENISLLQKYMQELPDKALGLGVRVLIAVIILFIGSKLIKLVRRILKKSLEHAKAETGVIQFLDGLVKIALYIVLVLMVAGNFGFDATSIVALLGSIGVTIGLALQGSLSNLAGGVLILILKPFKVGDYIVVGSNEGTVKEIGIFYTKLLTVDEKTVILPNGVLSNSSLTNVSTSETRRVDFEMSIAYDADIRQAKQVLQSVVEADNRVLFDRGITVMVQNLGASEVVIGVRCYCKNEDYWQVRWDLLENMKLALDAANIEIPFPQLSVHMDK